MRVARFLAEGAAAYGVVDGPELRVLSGHPLVNGYEYTGERVALKDVKLLAPTVPSKVVCIGKNYADHVAEFDGQPVEEPAIFFKPSTAIIGPGESIVLPWQSEQVELECELTIVMGSICKNVEPEDVGQYIWGYTVANDVTARDLQHTDAQWARSKAFDTFCPLGPWIETEFEPEGQIIETRVNGDIRQRDAIDKTIFNVREIIAHVTEAMTLLPGDVIFTGTPAGIQNIVPGDVVEVEIEGIGVLRNPVA